MSQIEHYVKFEAVGTRVSALPNSVREYLLSKDWDKGVVVLDLIYWLGGEGGQVVTVADLFAASTEAGCPIGRRLIREGLASGLFPQAPSIIKGRGRPQLCYVIPHKQWMMVQYGGADERGDMLDAQDFDSVSTYKQGLHREFIRRRPGQYTRAFLARRLGVSKAMTRLYEKAIKRIKATAQSIKRNITPTNLERVPEQRDYTMWLEVEGRRLPALRWLAERYIRMKQSVILHVQTANLYEYV